MDASCTPSVSLTDLVTAAGFVLAGVAEAVATHRHVPGLLAFTLCGAPVLAVLVVRRTAPAVPMCVFTVFVVFGTTIQSLYWPDASDSGGVWMFAMMFAAYSLGAHGDGPVAALGGLLPTITGLAIDLPTMSGWTLVSGVIFVASFVGWLPTVVGRIVRVRRRHLDVLEGQREQIVDGQQSQREAAVLAERVRTAERLQPALLDGLRTLARRAEDGGDPGAIEGEARELLGRTREEVVALAAPVHVPEPEVPHSDHLTLLRAAAQRWVVLGAGVVGAGLALEATEWLPRTAPSWVAVVGSIALCLPAAFLWWRPLSAAVLCWCGVVAYARLVAPLDGSLGGTAFVLGTAFAVAALSSRIAALAGLVLCWLGQLVGVGTGDPFGEAVMIFVCWLGGLVVNELSGVVELSRVNNRLLAEQEAAAQRRAVIDERLRLARELHDQIGHSLTVVALQAGAARRLKSTDPDRSREVLATIARAARDGLAAMQGDAATDLAALLRRTRAAGLEIVADVADFDALLDHEERSLAYRIVQEALTNALRHAPGSRVQVAVRREPERVAVEVRNGRPGHTADAAGSGMGLRGLRAMVTTRSGDLEWGPCADGGFRVRALLPARQMIGAGR